MKARFRSILASPLLHFFVLGGLIFGIYTLMNPASDQAPRDDVLRLSAADAQRLTLDFVANRHRAPTPEELSLLIRDWAVEEASVREALALGLDQGDAMIRNRLRNKIEFLAEAPAAAQTPDDATLESYYKANAARYSRDGTLSFTQVLLPPEAGTEEIAALKAKLEGGADPGSLSASTMLPPEVEDMAPPMVERVFGKGFAAAAAALPLAEWSGPLPSGFGQHLVRLEQQRDGALPPFAPVRDRVLGDWRADEARRMRAEYLDKLLSRYTLELPVIEDKAQP